jgi:serine/threonine-protein kinase
VPRDLETVCAKAMEPDPKRRYQSAVALARDLRNVLEKRPVEARPASIALQARRWVQRHPIATTLLAALIALPTTLLWQQSTHARELGRALDRAERKATDAQAMNRFMVELFDELDPSSAQGRELTARELLDKAAQRLEKELVDQPLARASLFNSIGETYGGIGEWSKAEELMTRGLELREEAAGKESLEVAESLRELSAVENQLGRPTAIEHAGRALELRRRFAPERDYEMADSLVTYGMMLMAAGRLDEAGKVYEEALEIEKILPGDQRDLRGAVLTHLASLRVKRGKPEEALAAAKEAIAVFRDLGYGPHPGINSCLNSTALANVNLERFDEARAVYAELLEEEKKLTGESSTRYASCLSSSSNVELRCGRIAEAIAILERAGEIFAKAAPPTHSGAVTCKSQLGLAYARAARWNDALAAFEAIAPGIDASPGPASTAALTNHVNIALCKEAQADWTAAENELAPALERAAEAKSADDDAFEAIACSHLARFNVRRGDLAKATELVERARTLRGDWDLKKNTAAAWLALAEGVLAQAAGDAEKARAALEPLAALDHGPLNAESTPAIARAHLATVLATTKSDQAGELAERARGELENMLGPDHPETRAIRE